MCFHFFGINATLNASKKFGLLFEYTGHGFFHHLGGVLALAGSKVLKLGFRGGCEVNFHASTLGSHMPNVKTSG
jgi:hypothetical protein